MDNLPKIIEYGEFPTPKVREYTFSFKNNFEQVVGVVVCLKKATTSKLLENVYLKSFNNNTFAVVYDCVNASDANGASVSYVAMGY